MWDPGVIDGLAGWLHGRFQRNNRNDAAMTVLLGSVRDLALSLNEESGIRIEGRSSETDVVARRTKPCYIQQELEISERKGE